MSKLVEELAAVQHDIWAHWMHYLFSRTVPGCAEGAAIPHNLVTRWQRQVETPYARLSESERESDREQARKVLAVLGDVAKTSDAVAALPRLREDVDQVLAGLHRADFRTEAINWADLYCARERYTLDAQGKGRYSIVIEEAGDGCVQLVAAVRQGLKERGWDADEMDIRTEW